jgi:hypothetical protein
MKVPHIYFLTAALAIPLAVGCFLLLDRFFGFKQRLPEGLNQRPYDVQSASRGSHVGESIYATRSRVYLYAA